MAAGITLLHSVLSHNYIKTTSLYSAYLINSHSNNFECYYVDKHFERLRKGVELREVLFLNNDLAWVGEYWDSVGIRAPKY